MSIEQVLAANLAALMDAHPQYKSQMKLCKASGVGQTTIGRMRRGEGAATIDNVQKIAKAFGLSSSDLLRPSLSSRITEKDGTALYAMQIADAIANGTFTSTQLAILANTLAALQSG